MRAEDENRPFRRLVHFFDKDRAARSEPLDDFPIVHDLFANEDRAAVLIQQAIDNRNGAVDTGAASARIRKKDGLRAHPGVVREAACRFPAVDRAVVPFTGTFGDMPHARRRLVLARLREMAPGVISAASDNDPTTVASLAVIGSTTVFALGWLVLLVIPMLAVVQSISSHVGAISKRGLEDLVRERYGTIGAWIVLIAVLVVNVLTLAADLEGGGAALHLLTGITYLWWIVPLAAGSTALLIFGSYARVERVLVFVPLAFLTYAVAAFLAHPDWRLVLLDSFIPHLSGSKDFIDGAIALLGTTLTAYAYVWQGIEISQERPPLRRLGLVQIDATIGAVAAGITFWFIVIATGATLGVHHRAVQTAGEAARALAPLAGNFSTVLFGIGLLGSALLAVPVLIATSAYVAAELFRWVGRLDAKFFQAKRFYVTMLVVAGIACGIAFIGIAPIRLLFASSIVGGIATPITLTYMLLAATNEQAMQGRPLPRWLRVAGWATTGIVTAACLAFFGVTFLPATTF
jgi:Mn2+/Fe2+ NRAMP family transporter